MIQINLLPPEILAEKRETARRANILKGLLLLAVLMAVGFNLLFALTLRTNHRINELDRQRMRINAEIALYQPYQQLQGKISDRSGLLRAAVGIQPPWRETLGKLGARIPDNVWLTSFSMVRRENDAAALIQGLTYDHPSTARWAGILGETPGIGDVRVLYSAEEDNEGETLVRFEIRAAVTAAAAAGGERKNE